MMTMERTEFDQRHGGAYDRGSADAYYGRPYNPHFYAGATYSSPRIDLDAMTVEEILAYTSGYNNTHERKEY